jgi:hypothetical protein
MCKEIKDQLMRLAQQHGDIYPPIDSKTKKPKRWQDCYMFFEEFGIYTLWFNKKNNSTTFVKIHIND